MNRSLKAISLFLCLVFMMEALTTFSFSTDENSVTLRSGNVTVTGNFPNSARLTAKEIDDPFENVEHELDPWWWLPWNWLGGRSGNVRRGGAKVASKAVEEELPEAFSALAYYDISVKNRGSELHPDGPVTITISDIDVPRDGSLQILHVLDDEDAIERAYSSKKAAEISAAAFVEAFPEAAEAAYRATGHKNVVFVEYYTTADGSLKIVNGSTVSFVSESFSVYILTETALEATIEASDGNTYKVTVFYDVRANIAVDAYLDVKEITENSPEYAGYFAASAEKLGFNVDNLNYLRLFDISIVSSRTAEHYQPDFPVRVSVELLDRSKNAPDLSVVHFGETTEVIDSVNEDGVVSFVTESFSIYSLGQGEHRDTYKFYVPTDPTQTTYAEYRIYNDQGETTFTQIIKEGEQLTVPRLPSIESAENSTFDAWYIGTGGPLTNVTLSNTPFDFVNLPDQADSEIHLYARFANFAYVIFHEQYNGNTNTWPITGTRRGELVNGSTTIHIADVTVSYDDPNAQQTVGHDEEPPPPAMAFRGWTTADNINPDNTIDFNVPLQGDANGDVTISANLELFPVFSSINWITYKSAPTGTGATYFSPEFLYSDEGMSSFSGHIPERAGYTFAGWYTAEEGGVQIANASGVLNTSAVFPTDSGMSIENGQLMLSKNVTVYGHWAPGPAKYVVVIWRQCVTDDKDAADADKTYDFAESIVIDSTSESTATVANEYKQRSGGDYTGFHYARCDADKTVAGNGSTVLNVYYDRDLKAIVFNSTNNYTFTGAGTVYVPTTSDSGTQYGYINGEYVQLTQTNAFYSADGGQTQYTGTMYITTTSTGNITAYGIVDRQLVQLTRSGNTWNRYWSYNGERYDGTVYTAPGSNTTDTRYYFDSSSGTMVPLERYSWTYNNEVFTGTRYTVVSRALCWTGLYGQTLAQAGYNWSTVNAYSWNEQSNGGGTTQTLLDSFNNDSDVYNLYCRGNSGTATIYHYRQQLDGTYTVSDREEAHGNNGTFYFSDKFTGYEVASYSSNNEGFRSSGGHHTTSAGNSVSYSNTLHVYHRRKTYILTYLDSYDNQYAYSSASNSTRNVLYGAPLTEYQPSMNPTPKQEGAEFGGWYYDSSCTVSVDFSKTMPAANMAIYAKWNQHWHLIKIDPNGGQLQGYGDYSTWFWKVYGTTEAVIEYSNTRRDYIESLNGTWYYAVKDRSYYGLTDAWDSAEDNINERTTYYTQDISDPAIVNLNIKYEYMRDAYRYTQWYEVHSDGTETLYNFSSRIDHDLLLKLHWKQVGTYYIRYEAGEKGTIDGADNNEDTFKFLEDSDYADRSDIIVTRTAVAKDEAHCNFIGWKIRGDSSNKIYYPGQAFEFESRFATTEIENGHEKKVLTLEAVYTFLNTARIIYDANGGVINSGTVDYGAPTDSTAPVPNTSCTSTSATISNLINNSDIRLANGTGFTRENAVIVGWNTQADAQGTHYDLNGVYGVDVHEPIRLYAEWGVKVYFDKNNDNADWGGTWDSTKYTWDADKGQYYTNAVIGRTVDEPVYIPTSSVTSEVFKYWTLERTSLDPVPYDFTQNITGEITIYGYWQLPIEIPVHAVDATNTAPVNKDADWLITNPSNVYISATTPENIGNSAYAGNYVDPDTGYMFAFTCLCESLDDVYSSKPVSRIYYNSAERALWADFTDGTNGIVNGSDQIWFVYFSSPKTVNIRYKVMNQDGSLSDTVMGRTGYPTTAQLNTYAMNETGHVDRPMYWANNTDYKFYTYAIGVPNATNSSQMRVITAASDSDANGSRPALSAQDAWDGFKYSQDGGTTWTDCGREIDLYVIYYTTAAQPTIVTINERTLGLQEDLNEYFDYTYTIIETTTDYTRTDTFTRSGSTYTLLSEGTPTAVGTPVTNTVTSDQTFMLKNGESTPKTLFYESTVPAPTGNYVNAGNNRYTRTFTYTVTMQTITVTQAPKTGFETSNDGTPSTPFVYTYTTASDSTNQNVTFTNTRTPVPVEVHVALVTAGRYVFADDTLRKTTPADYTVELAYGSTEALAQTSPVDPFSGDPDDYGFVGIIYGTRSGTVITAAGDADSLTYDMLTSRDYTDVYLNGDQSYLLGNNEIYYLYYLKPKIVYVREQGDGMLTMINPIRYNSQAVTLNGVSVEQNIKLNVTSSDFLISNSVATGYRVPPSLDGSTALSLDYVKIGAGTANVARTIDLEAVTESKELHLKVVDGVVKYSIDGITYTDFTDEPVVYVIYRDRADNILKIIRNDGAADQDFWYTINCPDSTTIRVCIPKGENSVSIIGVPYGNYIVTEQTEWSWRYESEHVQNAHVYNAIETRPAGAMIGYTEVTFSGNKTNTDWLNGYDSEVNRYGQP